MSISATLPECWHNKSLERNLKSSGLRPTLFKSAQLWRSTKMNLLHSRTLLFSLLLLMATSGHSKEAPAREVFIGPEVVYRFVVSLLELKERTQHKHLSAKEIQSVADIFRTAQFEKEIERNDVLTTPYISRYQFTHGYLGGTKKSGKTESGMLTIDAQTLYWKGSIFTLEPAEAKKLLEIIPKPVNENTISERPEGDPNNP